MTQREEILRFQSLGTYEWPAQPAEHTLRKLIGRIKHLARRDDDSPFVAEDKLRRAHSQSIDQIAPSPACGPVIRELEATLSDWVVDPDPTRRLRLIILPPGDFNDVVHSWATRHDHPCLPAPARKDLLSGTTIDFPTGDAEEVVVIPALEHWFLRHRNGLSAIRSLLTMLAETDRRFVIGCNSWAWKYLCCAAGANLVLPDGLMFQAFTSQRLYDWFSDLAAKSGKSLTFRNARDGSDLFELNEDDQSPNPYFEELASESMGIPWVAWNLWRRCLYSRVDEDSLSDEVVETVSDDEKTMWVAALDELMLPGRQDQDILQVLHALLLHGSLSAADLRNVVPIVGESNILAALIKAGIVDKHGDQIRCLPAAYPTVRRALSSAGFPMDEL